MSGNARNLCLEHTLYLCIDCLKADRDRLRHETELAMGSGMVVGAAIIAWADAIRLRVAARTKKIARQWTHGEDGARKRLLSMMEYGYRFDARDREALAFLLTGTELK